MTLSTHLHPVPRLIIGGPIPLLPIYDPMACIETTVFFTFCLPSEKLQDIGKGKAIPLQAWTGPGGSRRLRLPDFKTIGTRRW